MSTIIKHKQFPNNKKWTMDLCGRPLTVEMGKLAELASASAMLIGLIANSHLLVCLIVLSVGITLLVFRFKKRKVLWRILGAVSTALGIASLLEYFQVIGGIPILQIGIPAVLSLYFDLFSGFIQAFVFCLLTMVYISSSCPAPESSADKKPAEK